MTFFSVIAAVDSELGIAKNGRMPWDLKKDLVWFKKKTQKAEQDKTNAVIMGRKTYLSLPEVYRPLRNRYNVVLSETKRDLNGADAVFDDFDAALAHCKKLRSIDKVFVIGGAMVWRQVLRHKNCKELFLTHIERDYGCDQFFPPYKDRFTEEDELKSAVENDVAYRVVRYGRRALGLRKNLP